MRNVLAAAMLSVCVLGCQGAEPSAAPQLEAPAKKEVVAPPPVVAQLRGAGECRWTTCTLHFAAASAGDVDSLSVARCPAVSPTCGLRKGRLTTKALAQIKAIAARLQGEKLEPLYGCPGCDDGPIRIAVLHRADGTQTSHVFAPSDKSLPSALQEANELIGSVTDPLRECTTSDLVVAEPDCAAERAKDVRPAAPPPSSR